MILRDQTVEFLHRVKMNPNMNDIQFIKDKSLDFCKRQAFRDALEKAVELISTDKFESVVGLMKEAVALDENKGNSFFWLGVYQILSGNHLSGCKSIRKSRIMKACLLYTSPSPRD